MIIPFSKLQSAAGVFALLALLTSFVALITPAWQVVYAREIQQWVQSGLWLNCQTRPSGMYTCTYTFSESDFQFYTSAELINLRTPPFFAWQRNLLTVLLVGQLFIFLSLISLTLSFAISTRRLSAILSIVALAIAVLLHIGSIIAFSMFSQMVEYRFYHVSVSGIYEKHHGYSFHVEIAAAGLLIISMIFAISHLIKFSETTKFASNNTYFKQQQLEVQQHRIFDEEPYSLQQRSQQNSNNNSNNNIFGTNGSNYSGSNFGVPLNINQNYSYQSQPSADIPLPYHHYNSDIRKNYLTDSFEESAFAMRELPKVPSNYSYH